MPKDDSQDPQELVVRIPLYQHRELAKDVREHGELLAKIGERLERMDHDLFGNGQPGKIQVLEKDIQSNSSRVEVLEKTESHMKGWVAGVLFVALAIGGLAEFLYHVNH